MRFSPEKTGTGEDSRPQPNASVALAHDGNRFFQRIHGDFSFILGDDQRRRDADGARAATQEENSAFEGELHDFVALLGGIFFGLLVFDDLNADHETAAAHIADYAVPVRPAFHALEHVIANFSAVAQQVFALNDVHGGQRGRDANWISAEG